MIEWGSSDGLAASGVLQACTDQQLTTSINGPACSPTGDYFFQGEFNQQEMGGLGNKAAE